MFFFHFRAPEIMVFDFRGPENDFCLISRVRKMFLFSFLFLFCWQGWEKRFVFDFTRPKIVLLGFMGPTFCSISQVGKVFVFEFGGPENNC